MKIYLACPYWSDDELIRVFRFNNVCRKAAEIMSHGHTVFSPISHSHPIADYLDREIANWDFWMEQDLPFVDWCDEVWIYALPGWEESKGIKREMEYALNNSKPIMLLED